MIFEYSNPITSLLMVASRNTRSWSSRNLFLAARVLVKWSFWTPRGRHATRYGWQLGNNSGLLSLHGFAIHNTHNNTQVFLSSLWTTILVRHSYKIATIVYKKDLLVLNGTQFYKLSPDKFATSHADKSGDFSEQLSCSTARFSEATSWFQWHHVLQHFLQPSSW